MLFGDDYSYLHEREIVYRTQTQVVLHICSYRRLLEVFTKNGLCAMCKFLSPDEHEVLYACASKVWMKYCSCDAVGYVCDENDDEILVRIDGRRKEPKWLPRPSYDKRQGHYILEGADSSQGNKYSITDFWPIRFKIYKKSGKIHFTLNRILIEYDYGNDDLDETAILIQSKHIVNVRTASN